MLVQPCDRQLVCPASVKEGTTRNDAGRDSRPKGGGMVNLIAREVLKIAAWLALIGGLVIGVVVIASDEARLQTVDVALAIGIILQGTIAWAMLLVFAGMADDLAEIRARGELHDEFDQ